MGVVDRWLWEPSECYGPRRALPSCCIPRHRDGLYALCDGTMVALAAQQSEAFAKLAVQQAKKALDVEQDTAVVPVEVVAVNKDNEVEFPMNNTIVVVGSVNADLMITVERHPLPGETLHGSGGEITPGGKGANQAVAAALLGGDVSMVGAVGDDPNAGPATSQLRAGGVNLDHVGVHPGPTGLAVVVVDVRGENNIIVIAGANDSMDAVAVEKAAEVISQAAVVVLQGEIPRSGIERTAELAGGRLIVNLAPVLEVDHSVVLTANPLVVNEHEAALALELLGRGVEATGGNGEGHEAERAMTRELLRAGVRSVVLTLGADGALVGEDDSVTAVPSPKVRAIDTTGAGDAFVGALATRLALGDPLLDASAFAARVGAFACTSPGAQPSYPNKDDALPEVE